MAHGQDAMRSLYQAALGDELPGLHPRLQAYFSAIPPGHHGFGRGVFEVVGTPRRWLWPALAVLARAHVIFPVWERSVPFTVVNRPVVSANGREAVAAVRMFELRDGTRRMIDEIPAADQADTQRDPGQRAPCRYDLRICWRVPV